MLDPVCLTMNGAVPGSLLEFQTLVTRDLALFTELRHAPGADAFAELAVKLGRERGLMFSTDDVQASLQAARRAWLERSLG
jgi:hypothetical protein